MAREDRLLTDVHESVASRAVRCVPECTGRVRRRVEIDDQVPRQRTNDVISFRSKAANGK